MSVEIIKILRRFLIITVIQIFILKYINIGWEGEVYIKIFLYPLFVMLIPVSIPRILVILIAFGFGLLLDMFYDAPGLHTFAFVFIAWIRKTILKFLEPIDGYKTDSSLTMYNFGFTWFLTYSSILTFINVFLYFMMEAFAFQFLPEIIIKTTLSFILSEIVIILYMIILNPK
ncbi:MAG: hypothetical protein ACM3PT_04650 [Deltaproteobacteria bacterium]